jgi:hypothetical protein
MVASLMMSPHISSKCPSRNSLPASGRGFLPFALVRYFKDVFNGRIHSTEDLAAFAKQEKAL